MMKQGLRRIIVLLSLLVLLAKAGYAQSDTEPQEITVFLKNGKVVTGMTTLSMFEGFLTVEHDPLNQTHIPYADIEQIVFGELAAPKRVRIKKSRKELKPFTIKEKGYFSMIDFGALTGRGGYYDYGSGIGGSGGVSFTMVSGYSFNPYLRVGAGVGVESYGYSNVAVVPLFVSVSGLMNQRRWSPYYFLSAGGSAAAWLSGGGHWGAEYDVEGGMMLHPGLGYRCNLGKKGISFAVGYKIQKARLRYDWEEWNGDRIEVDERRTLRRLTMTVGFHF